MNLPEISVIIPTFNRWESLLKCLSALKEQTLDPSSYEVIVIDDGSTDEAYENNKDGLGIGIPNLRYLHQEKKGPSSARNLGIKYAKGSILIFLGDDIIASENLLREHLVFHRERFQGENFACLGYTTWPLSFRPTQFLQFMEEWGQFLFGKISDGEELNYNYFYSSNISLKKNFLDEKNLLFDEDFEDAAWEDIEFGYRSEQNGLRIIFNKNAIGYHNHYQTLESTINRMRTSGRSLFILLGKWPELSKRFGFLRTEKGFVLRHKLIKKLLRNKSSVGAMEKILKLFSKTIMSQQDTKDNENLQDRNVLPIDRRGFLTPQKGFLEEKKKPNKLLKEIYKNILLYYLEISFEEAQQNWQI